MTIPYIPSDVSYINGQSTPQYFKALTNFWNIQASIHKDRVFVCYFTKNEYKSLNYSQVDHITTNLACEWATKFQNANVISYIGDHGVNYLIILLAILKLRVTMMTVSPRNSEVAIIDLLEKTQSKILFADTKYESIAKYSASQIPGVKVTVIDPLLDIEALVQKPLNPNHNNILNRGFSEEDANKTVWIMHSSGSTSFPKPIIISNRFFLNAVNSFHFMISESGGKIKMDESDTFLLCVPMFHIFGLFAVFSAISIGASVVYLEKLPASPQEIDAALILNKCTTLFAPPIVYEQIASNLKEKKDFSSMRSLKIGFFGGAPLKREVGDWLQANGINVRNSFGSTECGPSLCADLDPTSPNWNSLKPFLRDPNGSYYYVLETNDEAEPDIKHAYIRADCPTFAKGISNRSDGGYDTNDLFRENPDYPGYYDYIGRRDDTLIMENGEKTNPVPMESTIRQADIVKQVAVIGHGRQCVAALVEVNIDYAIKLRPKDMILAVQNAVNEANMDCPSHSTILPQMIEILPLNQTLPSTDKGTVIRKRAEAMYQNEIEKLYKDFLDGPSHQIFKNNSTALNLSAEDIKCFLINSAAEVLNIPTSTFKNLDDSLFDYGLNSLLSIQLRNQILQYFEGVPQNFLFENSSIFSMCKALVKGFKTNTNMQSEVRYRQTEKLAKDYIEKAKNDFPVAQNIYNEEKAKVVMLTGATGSLGSFMLRDLLLDETVKKIYAVVRGTQENLMTRLTEAFKFRCLDTLLLSSDRLEVLPMCFSEPFLGFGEERYYQLKKEVTIVQHCAWLLDFNMPVDHFDKECIAPFYNLLKFAYKEINPMHVHFISSVSASAASGSSIAEEPLTFDSHASLPMGYAQSKFIVEMLFNYLTAERNFPCYIERLGQVCGDSLNGVWNISEQYPLMFIGGGSVMHKMPALDTTIDWITVDYAAAAIKDIMVRTAYLPSNPGQYIYHIVNPNVIHWNDILLAMRDSGIKFEVISPSQWVKELAKDALNPAYKLMNFYELNFDDTFKMPIWKTKKTSTITPRIFESPTLNSTLFSKFLHHWESVGFYNPSI